MRFRIGFVRPRPRSAVRASIRTLRRVGGFVIPDRSGAGYSFDRARAYWRHVPRAQGGNPFRTYQLDDVSDEQLVEEFLDELEVARRKPERKAAFDLAEMSVDGIVSPLVLDYGSGIGFNGFELIERRPDARVTFADIAAENLAAIRRIAAARGLSVETVLVRAEDASDLADLGPFDLIVSMGVLHHTPYAHEIVQRLVGFMKPGGVFGTMLYNDTYLRVARGWAGRRLRAAGSGFGRLTDPVVDGEANPYSKAYSDADAIELFELLELVDIHRPEPTYTTYSFRKPERET
jgi:SAM-dependent methyltransferase